MVGALDEEIIHYLISLHFNNETIVGSRSTLLSLEAGQSMVRRGEARGHCYKIGNIYDKYLKRWFYDALDANESQDLNWLFTSLSTLEHR